MSQTDGNKASTSAATGADPALIEVLNETNLDSFQSKLCDELQLTRLEHFDDITNEELQILAGLALPAIR
jgi:hypothetical protein